MSQLTKQVADAITQKPIPFKVLLRDLSVRDEWLCKLKLKKPYKQFYLRPVPLGKLIAISGLLCEMDLSGFDTEKMLQMNYELAKDHGHKMAEIVAIMVTRGKHPSPKLIEFFKDHLTGKELYQLVSAVIMQLDLSNFLSAILILRGVNILQENRSPQDQAETIAPGI